MMRKCHLNTCPVGIATQDPDLRKKFAGAPEHVINYLFMVAEDARQIMARLGFRSIDEMIGRVDAIEPREAINHWKADGLDLTSLLHPAPKPHDGVDVRCMIPQNHGLEDVLDHQLVRLAEPAIEGREFVRADMPIHNTNRTVGAILSHTLSKRWGLLGMPDGVIHFRFRGSAGQSFGAWLARGITLELEGDANDYVGKGLSGGRLIIYPPVDAGFVPEENILVGNVVLYGATSGQAFFRGQAAERFCVRNSGAWAVVEGCGDHGCEYMTGGRAVILGPTGRNFAAGMSGGIAYVWDPEDELRIRCNLGTVELEKVDTAEAIDELFEMVELHHKYTDSAVAYRILRNWPAAADEFVKVMPVDYKRVLAERASHDEEVESVVHAEGKSH
jgi:glutamate synthase (NADPH/NADH) large chain